MQSHHFDATYDPTIGFTMRLLSLLDSGLYTCRAKDDPNENEFDIHVSVISELKNQNNINFKSSTSTTTTNSINGVSINKNFTTAFNIDAGLVLRKKMQHSKRGDWN